MMKKPTDIFKGILLLVMLAALTGLYTCSRLVSHKKTAAPQIVMVSAVSVKKQDVTVKLSAIGTIVPYAAVSITPQVSGELLSVNFKEGDVVQKNQILFQIDPRPYQAKLDESQAQLIHDKAQLKSALLLLKRSQILQKKGYLDKQTLDQNQANADSLQATVSADEALISQAALDLSYCTMTSPITGRTGSLLINVGNIVSVSDKTVLVNINQIHPIYAVFSLPEKVLPLIQADTAQHLPVMVTVLTPNQQTETGVLSFVNNAIDPATGTIQLKASFNNEDNHLWAGQFVTVSMPVEHLSNALIIPQEAVQQGQEGSYVYVIDDNNTAHYRNITAGSQTGEGIVIARGLKAGEKVVTAGYLKLTDGSKVKILGNADG